MNVTEEFIFGQHMKNINVKYEEFSREIKSMQTPDTFTFAYATDIHYIRNHPFLFTGYYKVKEMVEFSKYIGLDLIALTGDIVDGNVKIESQERDIYDIISLVKDAKSTSVLISKGNHDDCSWYAYQNNLGIEAIITPELWYSYAVNPIRVQYPIILDEENIAGGYYYIDYPMQKIRVINLNTNDIPCIVNEKGTFDKECCGQWRLGISEKQLLWLSKVLKLTEPGWAVIFMSHDFLVNAKDENEQVKNGIQAWEIILGYKNGTNGIVKNSEKDFEANVEFDFRDNKSNDILPYLYGHVHKDTKKIQDGIVAVSTKNINGDIGKPWYDDNVVVDGCWDCMIINRKQRELQIKRFGIKNAERIIRY